MIEYSIEHGNFLNGVKGLSPTHKITLKTESDTSVFWYLQDPSKGWPLDQYLDTGLLREVLVHVQSLPVGDFTFLSTKHDQDLHIHRLGKNRFTIKAL